MRIFAIDPGPDMSGWVDLTDGKPVAFGHCENDELLAILGKSRLTCEILAIEWIQNYGMPAGQSLFMTALWVGRFVEMWPHVSLLVTRPTVKCHVCGSARAKDGNVRQALVDRFGGKELGIGRKKTPGPLYGLRGHCWAALAVAVTVLDRGITCGVVASQCTPW